MEVIKQRQFRSIYSLFSRHFASTKSPTSLFEWDSRNLPIEYAFTPPSSWYSDTNFAALENTRVFQQRWLFAAHTDQLATPGSYTAGEIGNLRYLLAHDELGRIRAFHNVCRHHGASLASGSGQCEHFTCAYHGWEYNLDGRLRKATRIKGINDFNAKEYGLKELAVEKFGPFYFIKSQQKDRNEKDQETLVTSSFSSWLGYGGDVALNAGLSDQYIHVASRQYPIHSNWKVFVENYLDGGMHIDVAHPGLASGLDLDTYTSRIYGPVSIQTCEPVKETSTNLNPDKQRLKGERPHASYIFIYPNLMINIYGDWMDINIALPGREPDTCTILFHYFLLKDSDKHHDKEYIKQALKESDVVQQEDIAICEDVQKGLQSPGYGRGGRYAPSVETPMHAFHHLLANDVL